MAQQSGDAGGTDYSSAALGSQTLLSDSKHRSCPAFASSRLNREGLSRNISYEPSDLLIAATCTTVFFWLMGCTLGIVPIAPRTVQGVLASQQGNRRLEHDEEDGMMFCTKLIVGFEESKVAGIG